MGIVKIFTSYNNSEYIMEGDYRWITVTPKIGGSAIGSFQVTNTFPQYHISYSEFQKNDAHLEKFWPNVPYLYLDQVSNEESIKFAKSYGEADFVFAVCPCSGLSMLNIVTQGSAGRGADAEKNKYMIITSKWVVEHVSPKVLVGENAPGLFSAAGEKVVVALTDIAKKFDYSFSILKTNTEQHGLPQKRIRTFYFFWKSPRAPILNWISNTYPTLGEYLRLIPKDASLQDVFIHPGVASKKYRPYQFVLEREALTHEEFSKKFRKGTIAKYLETNNLIDECIYWLNKYYPGEKFSMEGNGVRTHEQALMHIKNKLAMGKGYWDDSIKFMGDSFAAVIKKNIVSAIHPDQDRFFNLREILHLMGFPHDFEVSSVKEKMKTGF